MRTKSWRAFKDLRWLLASPQNHQARVLFVAGCQRSGTTLLLRLFDADVRARVFHEQSELNSGGEDRLRLRPIDEVNGIFSRVRHPLIVAKPLVESQNIREILVGVPGSRALWMFRHYRDVVQSSVRRFGGQVRHLQPIIDHDRKDWRAERVSDETHRVIAEHFSQSMPRHDAAALMWYARNAIYLELELDRHSDLLPCRYEDLVRRPRETMRAVYTFLGLSEFVSDFGEVHANSLDLGSDLELDPGIDALCRDLEERINRSIDARTGGTGLSQLSANATTIPGR